MAQQGAGQQAGKAEHLGRCGGHEDRRELGAVTQLGHKHQHKGFPDHRPGGDAHPAGFGRVDRLLRLLGFGAGRIRCHGLGIDQQLEAEAQKQGGRQPGHHALG